MIRAVLRHWQSMIRRGIGNRQSEQALAIDDQKRDWQSIIRIGLRHWQSMIRGIGLPEHKSHALRA
eukprot:4356340-Amphidinium_carterae.1